MLTRILIYIIGILLFSSELYAKMDEKLLDYYRNVNRAELFILDSNNNAAIYWYRKAFILKSRPFAKDQYNYATCLAIKGNFRSCYRQLKLLVAKGAAINELQKRSVLAAFFSSQYGNKLIQYSRTHKLQYNLTYRSKIDSIIRKDQEFRNKQGGYAVHGKAIRKADSLNVIEFDLLIAQYGFPSEEHVGIDSGLNFFRPIFHSFLIHQQHQAQNQFRDYTALLTTASEVGDIEIHAAAEYIDKSSGKDVFGFFHSGVVQLVLDTLTNDQAIPHFSNSATAPYGYFKLDEEKEKQINVQRELYGLEPLLCARRKTLFSKRDARFIFSSSSVSVLICNSREQYRKMEQSITWF